ncbi:MAG TPA: hypothetical protein EYP08_01280, partial [Pyrodictiaceae archaeon]|nr:hypothetical protein [Pyrodictiaceae archaeon]
MKVVIELDTEELVRVSGPAKLHIVKGKVIVLGAILMPGDEVMVHGTRSYAVKCVDKCSIEVDIGDGASIERPQAKEEPLDSWISKVDELLDSGCRSFIVVGPVDAGKTSIAALIANRVIYRGGRVAIVDADVGQADIGPPACVSSATVDKYVFWLRELYAEKIRFIGSIVPQRFEKRIVGAVVDLVWEYRKEGIDHVVVDTDGWISGASALEYKAEMARTEWYLEGRVPLHTLRANLKTEVAFCISTANSSAISGLKFQKIFVLYFLIYHTLFVLLFELFSFH